MRSSLAFVHGLGRVGRANWPLQTESFADAAFVTLPGFGEEPPVAGDVDAAATRILDSLEPGGVVVAHSYGALAAVHAAAKTGAGRIGALVLCEPALYSLPGAAVAAHNARMKPVFDAAADLSTEVFWDQFMLALTGRTAEPLIDEASRNDAERARLQPPPWELEIAEGLFERVPTLVVTGSWNDEYERSRTRSFGAAARMSCLTGAGIALRTTLTSTLGCASGSRPMGSSDLGESTSH